MNIINYGLLAELKDFLKQEREEKPREKERGGGEKEMKDHKRVEH